MANVFGKVAGWFETHSEDIQAAIETVSNWIETKLGKIRTVVGKFLNDIKGDNETVWEAVKQVVEKVWNKIESIWSGAGELLKPAIEMIRKAAAGDWAAAWKDMKDHARLALDTVLNILEEYLPKFADYGLALLSEIIDGLSAEGKGGKSILSRVTQLMVKIIAKLLEWVVKNVHKITPIGVEIGKGIAKGIWEALKGVPGEIVKRLGKAARGAVRRAAEEVTGDTGVTGEPEAGAAIPTGRPRQRVNPTTGELEDRPTGPTTQTTINITQPQSSQDINAAMTREILRGRI